MPSINNLVILLASAIAALPVSAVPIAAATTDASYCGSAVLPVQGATTTLPSPSGTLTYVALGRGIQNYTCSTVGGKPAAIGAVASLYDATYLAKCQASTANNLPNSAVYTPLPPSESAPFMGLPLLGHHFFAADGTPTFNLSSVSKLLYAAKAADIAAPLNASPGPANTGAVDWLKLSAKSGYASVGLTEVYRVDTAGGNPTATCASTGTLSIEYSALYWFYS
ncbi:hypothetical protein ACMFMG_007339 [Clarireedia jacksonii]